MVPWHQVPRIEHVWVRSPSLMHITVAENPGLCRSKYNSGRLGRAHPSWTPQDCTCLSMCWAGCSSELIPQSLPRNCLAQVKCQTKDQAPEISSHSKYPKCPWPSDYVRDCCIQFKRALHSQKFRAGASFHWPDLTSNSLQLTRFFVRRLDSLTVISTSKLPTPCCHCQVMTLPPKSCWSFWCRHWASENPKKGMCRWSKARHS